MDGYDKALLLTYLEQVPTFGACSEPELEHLLGRAELTRGRSRHRDRPRR